MHKLCLALVCLPAVSLAQQPAPAKAERFTRFAWPVPGDVTVVETQVKRGKKATMSYTIRLRKDPDHAGEIRVSYADFKFLTIDGQKADEMPVGLAQVLERALPDLRVDAAGKPIAAVDLDRAVDIALGFVEKLAKDSGAEFPMEQVKAMLKSPPMKSAMEESAKQAWNAWVGLWVGIDPIEVGKTFEGEVSLPMATDKPIRGKAKIKNNGDAKGFPGHVDLAMDSKFEGKALIEWFTEQTRQMLPPAVRANLPEVLFESGSLEQRVHTLIRRDTLQPARVTFEKVITLKPVSRPEREQVERKQVERHEYEFRWKEAKKTGADK